MTYIEQKLKEELKKLTFWDKITPAEQASLEFFCLAMNKDYHNHIVEKVKTKEIIELCDDEETDLYEREVGYNKAINDILSLLQDTKE